MNQEGIKRLILPEKIPENLMVSDDPEEFYAELTNRESAFEMMDLLSIHEEDYAENPTFWQIKSYTEQNLGYMPEAAKSIEKAIRLAGPAPEPQIQKAELLFAQGEDSDAIALLAQLEEIGRFHPELYCLHAEILSIYGDTENALSIINRGKKHFPQDQRLTCELVQILYDLERYDDAEVVIDEAFISHPDSENFLLLKAKILTERCDYTEALALIERSLTLTPENPELLEAKADVYFGTGDFDRAKRTYDEILKVEGLSKAKKAALYYNRALVLSNLNENEEALDSLDRAAECYQQDSYWYQLKATILMDMGELKEASAVLEEATFLYPEAATLSELSVLSASEGWWAGDAAELDARSHDINQDIVLDVMMGDVGLLYEEGKYDQAISVINECLELSDDKLPFLDSKANVLFESGDYSAALKVYDELIAILSENNESHHLGKESMLGALAGKTAVLIYLERFDDALSLIDAVLEENPKSIPILINKGVCYEKMGRLQEAFSWFEKASSVDPRSVDAWTARGRVLELLNENASALEAYVNAIRLDSTNLASRTNMIALLFKLKRYDDLLVHSDRALNIYPYDPSILNFRGKTLEILGRWEEASTCLERALEVSPENGELLFALGRILPHVNRDDEAFDRLMTAMKTLDDPSDVFSHVGLVLVRLGKCGAAVDILNEGLQEKPHQRDLIDERNQALQKLVVYSQSLA